MIPDDSLDRWQHSLYFLFCSNQIAHTYSHTLTNDSSLDTFLQLPGIAVVCFLCGVSLHVPWTRATCTLWERLRALWQLFLLALEFGGLRGPQSITALSSPHLSPLFLASLPCPGLTTAHQRPASCCDNSSYHDIKQRDRGSSPPPSHPLGPQGRHLHIQGSNWPCEVPLGGNARPTAFSCPASTSLSPSLCLTLSCCHFLTSSAFSCPPSPSPVV